MPLDQARVQPDLPIGLRVVRRIVWEEFSPPIEILELSDGTLTVNGSKVGGRPEHDGLLPPDERYIDDSTTDPETS